MAGSQAQRAADLGEVIADVKRGSLRTYGDWFGRPMDNIHVVRTVRAEGSDLIVGFDDDEELTVSDPADWEFSQSVFRVRHSSRVKWLWYH